jgi:hypothetical protein
MQQLNSCKYLGSMFRVADTQVVQIFSFEILEQLQVFIPIEDKHRYVLLKGIITLLEEYLH